MSELRDLPPISARIIWYRQIERQLDTYMRRVEAVLGKGVVPCDYAPLTRSHTMHFLLVRSNLVHKLTRCRVGASS